MRYFNSMFMSYRKMAAQKKQEFIINVPKRDPLMRYSIARFNTNLNVDINQWTNKEVHLRREDNRKEVLNDAIVQDYGAGSEYGKAAREEARRKKYGRLARSYQIDKQPWLLDIKESETKTRKYKSIVERTGEHADFWIFVKQGNKFFAHKVSEWYQFLPQVQHKVLDIEQAEEQFQQRSRVMNQFALKAQIQQQMKDNEEDGGKTVRASNLIIKDKDVISTDEEDDDDDEEGGADDAKKKQKKRNIKQQQNNKKKDKKVRVENGDEVAAYESDDGDDEGREFDYMSDSGSESDRETKTAEEKVDEALVAVGDEQGLKNMIDDRESDESDEEDEEGVTEENKELAHKLKEQENDGDGQNRRDSDDSDDEDPDATDINSPLLLQAKRQDDRKRAATDSNDAPGSSQPKKIKTEKGSSQQLAPAPLTTSGASAVTEREQKNMLEDQIRRLLMRRPHTTKELLGLIRPQFEKVEKNVLVNKLADVLKVLSPKQFRKLQGKKEILYFSLEP